MVYTFTACFPEGDTNQPTTSLYFWRLETAYRTHVLSKIQRPPKQIGAFFRMQKSANSKSSTRINNWPNYFNGFLHHITLPFHQLNSQQIETCLFCMLIKTLYLSRCRAAKTSLSLLQDQGVVICLLFTSKSLLFTSKSLLFTTKIS